MHFVKPDIRARARAYWVPHPGQDRCVGPFGLCLGGRCGRSIFNLCCRSLSFLPGTTVICHLSSPRVGWEPCRACKKDVTGTRTRNYQPHSNQAKHDCTSCRKLLVLVMFRRYRGFIPQDIAYVTTVCPARYNPRLEVALARLGRPGGWACEPWSRVALPLLLGRNLLIIQIAFKVYFLTSSNFQNKRSPQALSFQL